VPIRATGVIAADELENLRLGTREQWESDWTLINEGETHTFSHPLDEVPWVVSAVYSETQQGYLEKDATGDVTLAKTSAAVTCLNGFSDSGTRYFKVRLL